MLVCLLLPATHVHAEQSAEERLEEEGIVLLALRNDTIDTDQDGDIDAVRVVIVMNATTQESDLILKLRSLHKEREVLQIQEVSFENQTNVSLVYDAWSSGEHELRLDFFDQNGDFLASYPLPTFMLQPALKVPHVHLGLEAADDIKTGELCNIHREFADETGPRYGETGIRTFTGAPFSVLDSQGILDCSSWPAGVYELKETYRNGLGQTAESTLNFTILNRPAPAFGLEAKGHQNSTDTPCTIDIVPSSQSWSLKDIEDMTKIWSIKGKVVEGLNSTTIDCRSLSPGAYLVTVEVVTEKMISSTEGINIIRLPSSDLIEEGNTTLPSISKGAETQTESVGWFSIGALALVVTVLVFLMLVRVKEVVPLDLPNLGPEPQILADGSPDPQGLPTTLDDQGVLWRQHPDGRLDWWDNDWRIWQQW